MPTAYIMIGCPGVGKDTYIKRYLKNISVLSSDSIRLELFNSYENQEQEDNNKVFALLRNRMSQLIKSKTDFVYNATNTSIRKRIALYRELKANKYEVIAVIGQLSLQELYIRNDNREKQKQVPKEVIKKFYKVCTPPIINLDCDKFILFTKPYFNKKVNLSSLSTIIDSINNQGIKDELMLNFAPHESSYHLESIDEHINSVINETKSIDYEMSLIGAFHDLGKGISKNHNKLNHFCNYYNHANYGAMLAFNYFTNHNDINEKFVKYILLHMDTFNYPFTKKFKSRYLINDYDEKRLIDFNVIDKKCSIS